MGKRPFHSGEIPKNTAFFYEKSPKSTRIGARKAENALKNAEKLLRAEVALSVKKLCDKNRTACSSS